MKFCLLSALSICFVPYYCLLNTEYKCFIKTLITQSALLTSQYQIPSLNIDDANNPPIQKFAWLTRQI